MRTLAAILRESNNPLSIEYVDTPDLKTGHVLVKIFYSGLCHSQINEIKAIKGEDKYLPHTLGHEASAEILEIGPGVTKVMGGDYVVVSWIKGEGLNGSGIYYNKNGEKINSGAAATLSQYAIVSENRLTKIPKEVPKDIAALLGCAIPTGGGIILNDMYPKKGDTLAISGIGGIGASSLCVASSLDIFSKIIAIDIYDKKLNFAREIGATHTINANKEDVYEMIKKLTDNQGVDYSIEATGSKKAMDMSFKIAKEGKEGVGGGLTIISGNINKEERIEIYPFDLIKGKRIKGTWGGSTNPDKDIPLYARNYLDGKLKIDKLITKIYPIEQVNEAMIDLENGKVIRALIKCN